MVIWIPGLAWGDRGSHEPHGIAGCERNKRKVGQILRLGGPWAWGLGNLKTYCFFFFLSYSCFGLLGVPWARRGLVSPGRWALWVPSALSQPLGTPFTIPGGWNYSLRSRKKLSKPKTLAVPQGPRIGSWNLQYLGHPFLGHLPLPSSELGTNSADGLPLSIRGTPPRLPATILFFVLLLKSKQVEPRVVFLSEM